MDTIGLDLLNEKQLKVVSELFVHGTTNSIKQGEFPYGEDRIVLVPKLDIINGDPDPIPLHKRELRIMGWYDIINIEFLHPTAGTTSTTEPPLTPKQREKTKATQANRRDGIFSRFGRFIGGMFRRRKSKGKGEDKPSTVITEDDKLVRIDLTKLEGRQDEILKKLEKLSGDVGRFGLRQSKGIVGRVHDATVQRLQTIGSTGSGIYEGIRAYTRRTKIEIRGVEFLIRFTDYSSFENITKDLKSDFGPNIQVGSNLSDESGEMDNIVLVKLEPVGKSQEKIMYSLLEDSIKRHMNAVDSLIINKDKEIKNTEKDKTLSNYLNGLTRFDTELHDSNDTDSYKNLLVVLRLIHTELLIKINDIIKTLSSDKRGKKVIVLLPFCFVPKTIPSINRDFPEKKLYGSPGLEFINGVISITPPDNSKQILFDESGLDSDDQKVCANVEMAMDTLVRYSLQLVRGKSEDTNQILSYLYYGKDTGLPLIVSNGRIKKLQERLGTLQQELKNEYYDKGGEDVPEIFKEKSYFTLEKILGADFDTRDKFKSGSKQNTTDNFTRSSIIYTKEGGIVKIITPEEFKKYMRDIFNKIGLVYDVLSRTNGDIPGTTREILNSIVEDINDPLIVFKIFTTATSWQQREPSNEREEKRRERMFGLDVLNNIKPFISNTLQYYYNILLFTKRKGFQRDDMSNILSKFTKLINIINRFPKEFKGIQDEYIQLSKDKNIYFIDIEMEFNGKMFKHLKDSMKRELPGGGSDSGSGGSGSGGSGGSGSGGSGGSGSASGGSGDEPIASRTRGALAASLDDELLGRKTRRKKGKNHKKQSTRKRRR
jgi:uncharacterized membrane protein YgcG